MIISFATHKGGTGKTTASINLASGLARAGKKTLLVDMDPQGHSSAGLGIEIDYEHKNVADTLTGHATMSDIILETKTKNLYLAPSNIRLAVTSQELYAVIRKEEKLLKALASIQDQYAYIIIDCPPSIGALTWNALLPADLVIIPCQMAARSTDGLADLLDVLNDIKNGKFHDYRILLNLYDMRLETTTNKVVLEQLAPYKEKILTTIIHKNEAINQSQITGTDIFEFDPKSTGAQNFQELTEEVIAYGQKES